jgi:hypothetical protein
MSSDTVKCYGCKEVHGIDAMPMALRDANNTLIRYCERCIMDGTMRDGGAAAGAALEAICSSCGEQKCVKYSIETKERSYFYCETCFDAQRHCEIFNDKVVIISCFCCGKALTTESLQWTSAVHFVNLPGKPLFAKATCSYACKRSLVAPTNEILDGTVYQRCMSCERTDDTVQLRGCSRCKAVYYCSRECQKTDWKWHKKVCHAPSA